MSTVNWSNLEIASRRLADLQDTESYWAGRVAQGTKITYQHQQSLVIRRKDIEESILAAVCSTLVSFIASR